MKINILIVLISFLTCSLSSANNPFCNDPAIVEIVEAQVAEAKDLIDKYDDSDVSTEAMTTTLTFAIIGMGSLVRDCDTYAQYGYAALANTQATLAGLEVLTKK